jgi:hypothetical protein
MLSCGARRRVEKNSFLFRATKDKDRDGGAPDLVLSVLTPSVPTSTRRCVDITSKSARGSFRFCACEIRHPSVLALSELAFVRPPPDKHRPQQVRGKHRLPSPASSHGDRSLRSPQCNCRRDPNRRTTRRLSSERSSHWAACETSCGARPRSLWRRASRRAAAAAAAATRCQRASRSRSGVSRSTLGRCLGPTHQSAHRRPALFQRPFQPPFAVVQAARGPVTRSLRAPGARGYALSGGGGAAGARGRGGRRALRQRAAAVSGRVRALGLGERRAGPPVGGGH